MNTSLNRPIKVGSLVCFSGTSTFKGCLGLVVGYDKDASPLVMFSPSIEGFDPVVSTPKHCLTVVEQDVEGFAGFFKSSYLYEMNIRAMCSVVTPFSPEKKC